MRNSCKITQ